MLLKMFNSLCYSVINAVTCRMFNMKRLLNKKEGLKILNSTVN